MSILLYGCTTQTLTKRMGKKAWRQLHKNATSNIEQVVEAALEKQQLYGHLPTIRKTIKVRWTRHAGHCWRSRDELIRDVLPWTASRRPPRTYIQQLYADTGCNPEDLLEAMDDREGSGISVLIARRDDNHHHSPKSSGTGLLPSDTV